MHLPPRFRERRDAILIRVPSFHSVADVHSDQAILLQVQHDAGEPGEGLRSKPDRESGQAGRVAETAS